MALCAEMTPGQRTPSPYLRACASPRAPRATPPAAPPTAPPPQTRSDRHRGASTATTRGPARPLRRDRAARRTHPGPSPASRSTARQQLRRRPARAPASPDPSAQTGTRPTRAELGQERCASALRCQPRRVQIDATPAGRAAARCRPRQRIADQPDLDGDGAASGRLPASDVAHRRAQAAGARRQSPVAPRRDRGRRAI